MEVRPSRFFRRLRVSQTAEQADFGRQGYRDGGCVPDERWSTSH